MTTDFIIIGENIHTTRIIRRPSPRLAEDGQGRPSIVFVDEHGERQLLPIPPEELATQDYEEGRVKHVRSAVRVAKDGDERGIAYLRKLAIEQVDAGASYLDVNVDEYSHRLGEQVAVMQFLVGLLGPVSSVPLSIDSSSEEIIAAGLEAAGHAAGAPMLNSASLERRSALELAQKSAGPVIVTAAGSAAMPSDAEERVANAGRMIEAALELGIPPDLVYVDPLMFPISVDGAFGRHVLDAIREVRNRYGSEIHITGGMSNVSFGLPNRRLINDAFLALAVDAGADSGILDPTQNDVRRVAEIDWDADRFRLAHDVLTGTDRNCRAYIKASRAGELDDATAGVSPG
jgi:5-methyltetrahydrofolate corrinoid/iron sulfur protein methyltransferase